MANMRLLALAALLCPAVASPHPGQKPLWPDEKPNSDPIGAETACSYGCDEVPVANAELEGFIEETMRKWHAPGLAIAIVDGNKTWAKGFGHAILGSEPVTPATLFYAGSTTKSFTAAAVSLLVDDPANYSSVAWDSPVVDFLREDWLLSDAWATSHITVEDALSHRTGYPRHDLARKPEDAADMVRNFRNLPMSAEPRTKFQYCNLMFGAMGYLVSRLAGGGWLGDFFRERLWLPMGMNTTYLSLPDARASGLVLADEHWYNNDTDSYAVVQHSEFAWSEGAGMVISNVLDYSRYMRAMMAEAPPISKAGHAALKTPRTIVAAKLPPFTGPVYYGLGWFGGVFAGEEVWFHSGMVNGHISNMIMVPGRQFAVVTMLNAASVAQEAVFIRVLYDYLGVDADKRVDIEKDAADNLAAADYLLKTSRERLYPSVPDPPVRRPVSFENYAGQYHNAGYGTFNVAVDCSARKQPDDSPASPTTTKDGCRLSVVSPPRPGEEFVTLRVDLEHVSGDYWIGWAFYVHLEEYLRPVAGQRVQFRVDASGTVAGLGVDARVEGEDVPLVWFDRVGI